MVRSNQVEPLGDVLSPPNPPKKRPIGGTKSPIAGTSPGMKRSQLTKPSTRSGSGSAERSTTPSSTSPKVPHKPPSIPKDDEQPLPPPPPVIMSCACHVTFDHAPIGFIRAGRN